MTKNVVSAPARKGKTPVFHTAANIHKALSFIAAGDMEGFSKAGFSGHHLRQLGKGVSGGDFKDGLGFVETVKGTLPEGQTGRAPMISRLTKAGSNKLRGFELAARNAAKRAAQATQPAPEQVAA